MARLLCFVGSVSSVLCAVLSKEASSDFIWGTGTAAYQIEGAISADGRTPSIWDTFCDEPGRVYNGESGEYADNSYYLYEDDIKILQNVGVSHYRMSLSWSRILPDGKTVNQAGVDHYLNVFNALINAKIEPVVTLYHWDLPQVIYDETNGGWINSSIVDYFVTYAKTVFTNFKSYVNIWATFNEPWTFCTLGYLTGSHAPGRCSDRSLCSQGNSSTEPYLCTHNLLRSHAYAVQEFKKVYKNSKSQKDIGMNLNIDGCWAASSSAADVNASERCYIWHGAWYSDPLYFGDYADIMKQQVGQRLPQFTEDEKKLLKGSITYYGLNHYTTGWIQDCDYNDDPDIEHTWFTDQNTCITGVNPYNGSMVGPLAASSWLYVVPRGIYDTIKWVYERYMNGTMKDTYSKQPIYITENGCDSPNENETSIVVNDTFKQNFLQEYISYVIQAKKDGLGVNGYFVWSIMDNFEWADGYSKRFGIYGVNYTNNFERIERNSARWYSDFIKNNP